MKSFAEFMSDETEAPNQSLREAFVQGNLLQVDNTIFLKSLSEWVKVRRVGPNYIIVESSAGKSRHWLGDVDWDQGVK